MRLKKTLLWTGICTLFGLMLVLAIIFLLASTVPSGYRPYQLTQKERKDAANHFGTVHGIKLVEKIRVNKPFTHTISADDMNMYMASLDEIAFLKLAKRGEKVRSGSVYEAMDKAGLAAPVVTMNDGVLCFMVRTKQTNKVIACDLTFKIDDDHQLKVDLSQVRIGRMIIPQAMVQSSLDALKKAMPKQKAENVSMRDLDAILAAVIASIGEDSIPTKFKIDRKRHREIRDITIADGKLTVKIVPQEIKN